MADAVAQQIISVFEDGENKTGTSDFWVPYAASDPLAGAGAIAICTDLQPMSAAVIVKNLSRTYERVITGGSLTSSPYTARDKLCLELRDSQGRHNTWRFGVPKQSCFQSPTYEFAVTGSPVSSLVSALVANMVDPAGGSYTYVRGYRSMSRNLRAASKKFNAGS